MTLYANGIKVCPTIKVSGGNIDHNGQYLVKVVDYDGTVIKQDHLDTGSTFELPDAPTHDRLTFQSWVAPLQITNNSITVGKSDVTIGATYTTKSGLNEIGVEINAITGLTISIRGTRGSEIDWGDNTTSIISSSSIDHTYNEYGTYIIKSNGIINAFDSVTTQFANIASSMYQNFAVSSYVDAITVPNDFTGSMLTNFGGFSVNTFVFSPSWALSPNTRTAYFVNATNLENLILPYGATVLAKPLTTKEYSLEKVTFPSTITSLYLFQNDTTTDKPDNFSLIELNFTEHTSVPTLSASCEFRNPRLKIRVPKLLENDWKTATNWSAMADYIVGV